MLKSNQSSPPHNHPNIQQTNHGNKHPQKLKQQSIISHKLTNRYKPTSKLKQEIKSATYQTQTNVVKRPTIK